MHTDALKPIGTKVAQNRTKPCEPLCGPAVNFQSLAAVCLVSYINGSPCASIVEYPLGPRFLCDSYLTRTALRFGRCLLSSHVLLRSRFAHALRSLVSQRKRRAAAHNRVVLGSENPHSWGAANQALGGAVATGVLGNPAIALCAVPLLIPVSALIWAQVRP